MSSITACVLGWYGSSMESLGKLIAWIVRGLGIDGGALGNWVVRDREADRVKVPGVLTEFGRVGL